MISFLLCDSFFTSFSYYLQIQIVNADGWTAVSWISVGGCCCCYYWIDDRQCPSVGLEETTSLDLKINGLKIKESKDIKWYYSLFSKYFCREERKEFCFFSFYFALLRRDLEGKETLTYLVVDASGCRIASLVVCCNSDRLPSRRASLLSRQQQQKEISKKK